jgi:hypothetical protein
VGISKKWSDATGARIAQAPANVGVYEFAYNKRTVYVGSGTIRDRLQAHNRSGYSMTHFRYEETNSRMRAVQRERKLLKQFQKRKGRLPKYNDEIPNPPR